MSLDSVHKKIRAALGDVVASEKRRLHEFYGKSDATIASRIEIMRPVINPCVENRGRQDNRRMKRHSRNAETSTIAVIPNTGEAYVK